MQKIKCSYSYYAYTITHFAKGSSGKQVYDVYHKLNHIPSIASHWSDNRHILVLGISGKQAQRATIVEGGL